MKQHFQSIKIIVIALILATGISYAQAAWTGPTSTPPNNNVSAPINVGAVDQIKDGALGVNTLAVYGNGAFSGYVKIGTTIADCVSSIEGAQRYLSGSGMQYCDGTDWKSLAGGVTEGGSYTGALVNGVHTGDDCVTAGGITALITGGEYVCRFNSDSCFGGWSQYEQWSVTTSSTCNGRLPDFPRPCGNVGNSCTTGEHPEFSNIALETCSYTRSYKENEECAYDFPTCYATYNARGCY